MGERGGKGKVTPRQFTAARITSQVNGNTQRLTGGTQ